MGKFRGFFKGKNPKYQQRAKNGCALGQYLDNYTHTHTHTHTHTEREIVVSAVVPDEVTR